jgi:Na+-translocating ferredoxin:NAD+ oxidoreductase RNF subunit RnfB
LRPLVKILKDKCKVSYSCVRVCPVNAIKVTSEEEAPVILPERCIGCGDCIASCTPDAIVYRDAKEETKDLLKSGKDVAALIAPSISSEFNDITDYRKFVQMVKALGFIFVHEVSFGVDLVAQEYSGLINDFKGKYYLTANCPVVVDYIEKYHPGLLENLAPVVSPMIATAGLVKKKHGGDIKIVYIGPCIANKDEAHLYESDRKVDAVLTFVELRELFKELNITESTLEFSDFDGPSGSKGNLYPISNGFLEAAGLEGGLLEGNIITASGKENMLEAIREFENEGTNIKSHFNLFYCDGCMMGPGTSPNGKKYKRRTLVTNYAKKRLKGFDFDTWKKEVDENTLVSKKRSFRENDHRLKIPSEEKIQEILKLLEIKSKDDELGCAACGYNSCREFAIAVASELATPEMCYTFALKNKQNYIKTLKITNEQLAQTQEALKESEKFARLGQETANEASTIVNLMLQKIPTAVVIVDKGLKIIQSNESFIKLIGEEAREINEVIPGLVGADLKTLLPHVFYNLFSYVLNSNEDMVNRDVNYEGNLFNVSVFIIKRNKIVGAVIRDMSDPEVQKEEVINRVSDVIDKNLELVQKIGFLLGEGASETEKMLNSIIQSYKSTKK